MNTIMILHTLRLTVVLLVLTIALLSDLTRARRRSCDTVQPCLRHGGHYTTAGATVSVVYNELYRNTKLLLGKLPLI